MNDSEPRWIWKLFRKLCDCRFPLGPQDYGALRDALRAGFGWASDRALCDLCIALWGKSAREAEVVRAFFEQLNLDQWELPEVSDVQRVCPGGTATLLTGKDPQQEDATVERLRSAPPRTGAYEDLPFLTLEGVTMAKRRFVFVPQFPLTHREVAQAWRRLRRPVRSGPPVDLDVDATVARRARRGVATPLVLLPRRRNTTQLLLLVDRNGSMAPYHRFVDEVAMSIQHAGWLGQVALYYFHDVPLEGADTTVLDALPDLVVPQLDSVLPEVAPLVEGDVYRDVELGEPQPLSEVVRGLGPGAAAVVIGDAGAARGRFDLVRLLDSAAFLKGLRAAIPHYAWLNPVPREDWQGSTAAQLARHAPMFPLDRPGLDQAIQVLRGCPPELERPL